MYCTTQKVRAANELLEDAEIFTDDKISPWITKAESRIDAKLRERYITPLVVPVPSIIESIAQDMAAGFVILNSFSNQLSQELLTLGNQYLKRADADLNTVIEKQQLDGLPGVRLAETPGSDSTPAISSTTKKPSPIEGIINQW